MFKNLTNRFRLYKHNKRINKRKLGKMNFFEKYIFKKRNIIYLIIISSMLYGYLNYHKGIAVLGVFAIVAVAGIIKLKEITEEEIRVEKAIKTLKVDMKRDEEHIVRIINDEIDSREETSEKRNSKAESDIKYIIQKDEEGYDVRSWNIKDSMALLIGKKNARNRVDIDLASATYSSLISKEHGLLNKTNNGWYFEDIGSINGSGIEKKNDKRKLRVKPLKPIKVQSGDVIYISNTKLLLK